MIGNKRSLLGAMLAALAFSLPSMFATASPPNPNLQFTGGSRSRSRGPNSNRDKRGFHSGTNIPHGKPGAKLSRMAAEGRLVRHH